MNPSSVKLTTALTSTVLVTVLLYTTSCATAQSLPEVPNIDAEVAHNTARVNGVEIHYATAGSGGDVVLLWHGFLGNWASYRKLIPLLVDDHTVVVPDMRGYGRSAVPDSGYDARTLMRDYHALMERLGHNRYHVIAHDMGAPPALLLAAEHPEEVQSLTYIDEPTMLRDSIADLIEMTPEDTHYGGLWWWMMAQSPSMTETLVADNERDYLNWFYDNYAVPEDAIEEAARAYFAADLASERGIHGWFGVYRDVFETIEQTAPLANDKVEVPVLGIGGEMSMGTHTGEMLGAVATNVTTVVAPGSGHFVAEEVPEWLAERWREFVVEEVAP